MLPQPRKSKKTKRASAPSKALSNDLKMVQTMPTIQSEEAQQQKSQNNDKDVDLLNLFDDFNDNSNGTNKQSNNNKTTDDFFDLFDSNTNTNTNANNANNKQQPRNTVNTLQIHPDLMKPRQSRSLEPDKLFDVAMWQNFDNNKAGKKKKEKEKEKVQEEKKEKEKEKEVKVAVTVKVEEKEKKEKMKEKIKAAKKETNALEELHRGAALLKYPRRSGFPHFKHIQLSSDNLRIEWFSKRKHLNQTCIFVKDIREVVRGQETEVFKKFHQKTLEKSSFSVVYGHSYKTLDVAAKSIDECEMWVKSILKLCQIYKVNKKESDLSSLRELYVGIHFKDRNRPMSRQGSGNFIRANSSKNLKIDPVALKEIERDMEALHKTFHKTAQLAQKELITKSNQYSNIQYVLSELEERIEELTYEVANIRDTELAKREVWRANVDLSAIQEKVEVLLKHLSSKSDRRKSNFL